MPKLILHTACFTAHRPEKLGGYDETNPLWVEAKAKAYAMVESTNYHFETTKYISGMALGGDMIFAEAVLDLRDAAGLNVKLIAAIPFLTQWSRWPRKSFERWLAVVMRADWIYVGDEYIKDRQTFFAEVMALADRVYRLREKIDVPNAGRLLNDRNIWMVNHSVLVISLWDSTSGGTCNCLTYADKMDTPCIIWRLDQKRYEKRRLEPMVLECSSKGDKRGSALFAETEVLGKRATIENHYQLSKVFWLPHPRTLEMREVKAKSVYEAKEYQKAESKPYWFYIGEYRFDVTLLSAWYDLLWIKYLNTDPAFVEYLKVFDDYHDIFKGKRTMNCQADAIREYITKGPKVMICRDDIHELCALITQRKIDKAGQHA